MTNKYYVYIPGRFFAGGVILSHWKEFNNEYLAYFYAASKGYKLIARGK